MEVYELICNCYLYYGGCVSGDCLETQEITFCILESRCLVSGGVGGQGQYCIIFFNVSTLHLVYVLKHL